VAAAVRAERDGFDAAFINSTSDYGLTEIRSIVGMPVVGGGEAGLKVAASLGRHFALIQVWPVWARWIGEEPSCATG
jgi:Asp/Glu/hydantoin racemase